MPHDGLAVEGELDFKIVSCEFAVGSRRRLIVQLKSVGLDHEVSLGDLGGKLWYRQAPIQKDQ